MRILFAILILALFLRFWTIGNNPPSLTWDEASWGYNAYSLGLDGRDEFGRFLPVAYLESFGDFKPPMYAYLDVIPVKLFGLNEFAVRFPSAFFGFLTVLITYFLTRRIFEKSKKSNYYALFASFFLAISPWHVMLSRAAFEANVASFFIILGIFLFLTGVKSTNKLFLIFSFISFVLSMYTFNTARIFSPLIFFSLLLLFRKEVLNFRKNFVIAAVVPIILFLPLAKFLITPQASLRFKEVNIFSDIAYIDISNREVENDKNAFFSKVLHNRRFIYSAEYLKHYFDNFTPNFLFGKGDGNPKFSIQEVGQLYLWDLPFLIIGILLLFKKKEGFWYLIPLWIILGVIPAATARETPHALRVETILPTLQILVAYGFVNVFNKKNLKLSIFVILLLFINFLYFTHNLLTHYPKEFSGEWQYGYKESINYVKSVKSDYEDIYITDQLGRPYIYYLFYTKENPKIFRENVKIKRDVFGFVNVEGYDKFKFTKDPNKTIGKNSLYINLPGNVPANAKRLKTFYLLNGTEALVAYTI